jgi:hypothetical protein
MNIIQAMDDPAVFGAHFRTREHWQAWRAFLAALFGLGMSAFERNLFQQCTGRQTPPKKAACEAWLVIGRRGGKSFILAVIAVFLACFRDWRPYLGPGERATVMIIAADRRQARVIMRYVKGLLQSVPMLAAIIESETRESINLTNRVTIEIHTASFRTIRGYTVVAALCDEIAFWPTDDGAANPDTEILAALRPAMATVPGAMLLCASSPYARRGALWDAWHKHYGKDDPVLVWQAPTRTMNPIVPQSIIDDAIEADPEHAKAEYLAEFRTDIAAFVSREIIEAAVERGVHVRAPIEGVRYFAFVDPSGGVSDSMTLAIAHAEKRVLTLDAVLEHRSPFSPEAVVAEFAQLLKSYRITAVVGDRYAGDWPKEAFARYGIKYQVSDKTRSDIYRDILPEFNSGQCSLLDNQRLVAQFVGLERRTSRGGRDVIDHAPSSHDDLANAAAGALLLAKPLAGSPELDTTGWTFSSIKCDPEDLPGARW